MSNPFSPTFCKLQCELFIIHIYPPYLPHWWLNAVSGCCLCQSFTHTSAPRKLWNLHRDACGCQRTHRDIMVHARSPRKPRNRYSNGHRGCLKRESFDFFFLVFIVELHTVYHIYHCISFLHYSSFVIRKLRTLVQQVPMYPGDNSFFTQYAYIVAGKKKRSFTSRFYHPPVNLAD